jgi:hypothetical protein
MTQHIKEAGASFEVAYNPARFKGVESATKPC